MIALIDGDIVAYRVACTLQEDDHEDFAYARTEDLVDDIIVKSEADSFKIFLTGKDNFRYTIYPEYKAHRPKEKPFWLEAIRQYLIATFNADPTSTTGYSANTNGSLFIYAYPTTNNANFKVCNNTASNITPGAATLNWRVTR